MTAREYLESKGLVVEQDGQLVIRFERNDGNVIRIVTAPLGYVLTVFGPVIEAALVSGLSPYDALMTATFDVETTVEGPDGQPTTITVKRTAFELGWAGHFGALKASGKLD